MTLRRGKGGGVTPEGVAVMVVVVTPREDDASEDSSEGVYTVAVGGEEVLEAAA